MEHVKSLFVSKTIPRYVGIGKIQADSSIMAVFEMLEPCDGKISQGS